MPFRNRSLGYKSGAFRSRKRYGAPSHRHSSMKKHRYMTPRRRQLGPAQLYASVPESKAVDFEETTILVSSTQNGLNAAIFNLLEEGASFYNRVGRRIKMKDVTIDASFGPTGTVGTQNVPEIIRVFVVYDKQSNGALPALSDILLDYNAGGTTSTTMLSHLNLNNRDRFLILADERHVLPPVATTTGPAYTYGSVPSTSKDWRFTRHIKLRGLESHYKASAGTIGDLATGSLFLFWISGYGTSGGVDQYELTVAGRMKFHDC